MSGIPAVFAIFHRNIEGDEALLRLARRRFERAGLGAEFYPGSPQEALWEWQFAPSCQPQHMVHLPRNLDLRDLTHQHLILEFARALGGRARGLVIHDQPHWRDRIGDVVHAASLLDGELGALPHAPCVFIEYAAGLPLPQFVELGEAVHRLGRLGICIDIGHISIAVTRLRFAELRPDLDFWTLAADAAAACSALPDLVRSCTLAESALLEAIDHIAAFGGPIHFHLHDAQPLSRLSPYGVRDHLSFLERVPVPERVSASGWLPTMLGRRGLERVVASALGRLPDESISLTLEIHHTKEQRRSALGEDRDLFGNWTDLSHAEQMSGWLAVLVDNAALLEATCRDLRGSG